MANLPRFRGILLQGSPTAGMRRGEMSRFMLGLRPFSHILALVSICTFFWHERCCLLTNGTRVTGLFWTNASAHEAYVHRVGVERAQHRNFPGHLFPRRRMRCAVASFTTLRLCIVDYE
jgi:hypothetical protein